MENEYINVLQEKLEKLKDEKNQKTLQTKELLHDIEIIQKSIDNIIQLLNVEGVQFDEQYFKDSIQITVSDLVFDFLQSKGDKQPRHYMEIYNGILSLGKSLPGKNPSANMLTHIARDNRFVRVSSGTYGLREWGIEPPVNPKSRKKRRTIKKRAKSI